MLTTHLCVPFGLFNGATGTIIDLIYKNENQPENSSVSRHGNFSLV
jgi:hypothetical protein